MNKMITRTPQYVRVGTLLDGQKAGLDEASLAALAEVRAVLAREADDLLAEFYGTFEPHERLQPTNRDPLAAAPKIVARELHSMSHAERAQTWERERIEALPKLRELTSRIDQLRLAPVGLHGKQVEQRTAAWRAIIVEWNDEVIEREWKDIATVCEGCGALAACAGFDQVTGELTRFCRRQGCKRAARARDERASARRAKRSGVRRSREAQAEKAAKTS